MLTGLILAAACCGCAKQPAAPTSLKVEWCNVENVVKALELAKQFLPVDVAYGNDLTFTISETDATNLINIAYPDYSTSEKSRKKRKEAAKLIQEADELDSRTEDAKFIMKVLKACKE